MKVNDVVSYDVDGSIAVITVNSPPVNALSNAVRQGVAGAIQTAMGDAVVGAVVLICEGRTFFAGADITEFGKPPVEPTLRNLQLIVENTTKPVVAAIHGTALGGGLDVMLQLARHAWPALRRGHAFTLAVMTIMCSSLVYEWFEWAIALALSPDAAEAYNGQQGDLWDAHADMLMATVGSLLTGPLIRRSSP